MSGVDEARATTTLSLVGVWGIAGVLLTLVWPLARLIPIAVEPLRRGQVGPVELGLMVAWVAFMAYSEGYRGFQRGFSPRVVARAQAMGGERRPMRVLTAPLSCMGLVFAPRRQRITSWSLLLGISLLVVLIRQLAQPWRGIVDAGVVVGLTWGVVVIVWHTARAARGRIVEVPADRARAARQARRQGG